MNDRGVYAILGIGFVLLACSVWYGRSHPSAPQAFGPVVAIAIGDVEVVAEVVDTPEERAIGLSGRLELPQGEGMFFVFPEADTHGFWMPDMHFAIDIIWLNANFEVVHIAEEATPASYPEVFTPSAPALYALEVPAGYASAHQIAIGSRATVRTAIE